MRRDGAASETVRPRGRGIGGDLALLGAPPAFADPLVVGRPNPVDKRRVLERIEGVLERNWLTNHGPLVGELEARLADMLGVSHVITTSSGTSGLQLVGRALGLHGEVIVPSFTFIATAHAMLAVGATPVFADIDDKSHCLDPAAVEAALTPRTTAVVAAHLWGNAAPVAALERIANANGLQLVHDAAHALGSEAAGRPIGGFGRAEVFSLHATKIVNGFEGGFVTTDDGDLAARLREAGNFGFVAEDRVDGFGVNAKMSEASAAMALTSLEGLDVAIAHNEANLEAYLRHLDEVPGLSIVHTRPEGRHNRHYVVAEVNETELGLTRDGLVAALRFENVMARRYFHPGCHAQEPYRTMRRGDAPKLPVTESVAQRVLVLPTGRSVSPEDIARLARCIEVVACRAPEVRRALTRIDNPALATFREGGARW